MASMASVPPLNQPGFDMHADQGGLVVAVMITLISLSLVFVLLRLLSRRLAGAGYWWDDILVIAAELLAIVPPVCNIIAVKQYGFGHHIWVLGDKIEADTRETYMLLWIFQLFFCLATGTIKLSVLTFYQRIFRVPELKRALAVLIYVVTVFLLATILVSIFQCAPIHKFWDTSTVGYCLDPFKNLLISGSINTTLDFVLVLLPMPLLWSLRTSVRQKCILTVIFVIAGFVCVVSIIRLRVFIHANPDDATWNSTRVTIWSAVEPCVGVITGCIPSLRPLISGRCWVRAAINPSSEESDSTTSKLPWIEHHYKIGDYDLEVVKPGQCGPQAVYDGLAYSTTNVAQAQGEGPTRGFRIEDVEVPFGAIAVKTEIRWSWNERMDYDSRLY